jgi:demethylmenaquinone methyltransferase/2-methoxy-6-polyprenyl-1,4-benzoquinol methylase
LAQLYPDSHVEIHGFLARHYDLVMNVMSGGLYSRFISSAVSAMHIRPEDRILDLGCGTGRNACLMRRHLSDQGYILGMDISEEMGEQFRRKCSPYRNVAFMNQRADVPFSIETPFDKIVMSFVLHGFPHESRLKTLENIYSNLKPGGKFLLLDFAEFKLADMPPLHRKVFTTVECSYAFEFVEMNWQEILRGVGFTTFAEHYWLRNYVRLLAAMK